MLFDGFFKRKEGGIDSFPLLSFYMYFIFTHLFVYFSNTSFCFFVMWSQGSFCLSLHFIYLFLKNKYYITPQDRYLKKKKKKEEWES